MKTNLPVLYGLDKAGKERYAKIWTEGNVVHKETALVGGKATFHQRSYGGKSLKTKAATTPEEQAVIEAQKDWVNFIKKGYAPKDDEGLKMYNAVLDAQRAHGGHNINSVAAIGGSKAKAKKSTRGETCAIKDYVPDIKPMLCKKVDIKPDWDQDKIINATLKGYNLAEGIYVQEKMDGWRCIVDLVEPDSPDGEFEISLSSRTGKQFPWFCELRKILKQWYDSCDIEYPLDGELCADVIIDEKGNIHDGLGSDSRFQKISEICGIARKEPHKLENQIKFYVFDIVDDSGKLTQQDRFTILRDYVDNMPSVVKNHVVMVQTRTVHSKQEVMDWHDKFTMEGKEGVILRSKGLKYEQRRANFLRKYKFFIDAEYEVVSAKLDPGVATEQFVWICVDPDTGKEFSVKPMGNRELKLKMYANRKKYYGRMLTVKYQSVTADNVPRFGVGKAFREDL